MSLAEYVCCRTTRPSCSVVLRRLAPTYISLLHLHLATEQTLLSSATLRLSAIKAFQIKTEFLTKEITTPDTTGTHVKVQSGAPQLSEHQPRVVKNNTLISLDSIIIVYNILHRLIVLLSLFIQHIHNTRGFDQRAEQR